MANTIFRPDDLSRMGRAFDAAVTIAVDEGSPFAVIPVHELRRRLADAVMHGARRGQRDPDRLKAEALCAVAATLMDEGDAMSMAA